MIYVDKDATGSDNGTSWTNAYVDLQDALAAATNGDEIWVAQGVYKPTTTTDRDIAFVIPDGVSLYGGFSGSEGCKLSREREGRPPTLGRQEPSWTRLRPA